MIELRDLTSDQRAVLYALRETLDSSFDSPSVTVAMMRRWYPGRLPHTTCATRAIDHPLIDLTLRQLTELNIVVEVKPDWWMIHPDGHELVRQLLRRGAEEADVISFKLKRPCPGCPFRRGCLPEWLGRLRAEEIAGSVLGGETFCCHETTQAGGGRRGREQHCAGGAILLERLGRPNQLMRVAERLGLYDPEPCAIAEHGCQAPAGYRVGQEGFAPNFELRHGQTEPCTRCGSPSAAPAQPPQPNYAVATAKPLSGCACTANPTTTTTRSRRGTR